MGDEIIYVAVGKDVEERKSTLKWAFEKFKQEKSCCTISVFYVHVPAQMITLPNGFEVPAHSLKEHEVEPFREWEMEEVAKILHDCGTMCKTSKVPFFTFQIQNESIPEGIMELIGHLRIRKLVMGAGANRTYSRRMSTPTSKKANFVLRSAPDCCHIWFVCKNHLIFTREGHARQLPPEIPPFRFDYSEFLATYSTPPASTSQSPIMYRGSSPMSPMTPNVFDILYSRLKQVDKESKETTAKMDRESKLRQKAEEEASEANRKVEKAETDINELEEELTEAMTQLNNVSEELFDATAKIVSFETQTETLNLEIKALEKNLESSENSQKLYKTLFSNLQKKYIDLFNSTDPSTRPILDPAVQMFSSEYSRVDLEEATNGFDPLLKIVKGGYGDIYRGFLNHTDVTIQMINSTNLQGRSEFKQEVEVLSKLRHPNLVTLIGTCAESRGLIYEYLPNGTLQDRLDCKDNTPALPWQTRIQIATDLCSVLIFLHSRKPNSVIHTDINPKNIFLDANFICKLSVFGSCHIISNEFCGVTGRRQVSPNIDVYSFGISLLCLLTAEPAEPALVIVNKVKYALENDDLYNILDHSAGQWPFVRATQLAHLALRCCQLSSDDRPDLATEVWMVLKPTRDPSWSLPKALRVVHEDRIPPYFICPILQEMMHDPQFAPDGFTYEASAIQTWFEGGHDTSPMTNLRLADRHLTPNHSLNSAMQEWRQKYRPRTETLAHLFE